MGRLYPLDLMVALVVLLLITSVVFVFLGKRAAWFDVAEHAINLATVIAAVLTYVSWRWERAYLVINRLWHWLFNTSLNISWCGTLQGRFTADDLHTVETLLQERYNARLLSGEHDRFVVSIPRWALRVLVSLHTTDYWQEEDYMRDSGIGQGPLILRIDGEMMVGFRAGRKIMDHVIMPILEAAQNQFELSWQRGEFSISLPKVNPYWGLLVRRLPREKVASFSLEMVNEQFGGRDTVRVGTDRVEIVADTMSGFRSLAEQYLGLGGNAA